MSGENNPCELEGNLASFFAKKVFFFLQEVYMYVSYSGLIAFLSLSMNLLLISFRINQAMKACLLMEPHGLMSCDIVMLIMVLSIV